MPGPCAVMVRCCPPKLMMLMVTLLVFAKIVCLHGNAVTAVNNNLHCVSDYVSIINCSLNNEPSPNSSDSNSTYWLTVVETYQELEFVCMLIKNNVDSSCSVKIYNPYTDDDYGSNDFTDNDSFDISLCHNQSNGAKICKQLMKEFEPFKNVKPNPPCCLNLSHQSGRYHFTWNSTYEQYSWFTTLANEMMFQLHYYKKGDKLNVLSHGKISVAKANYSVDDHNFLPDTEYLARVRSSPNQAYFEGQWSSWSSEVNWRTKPAVNVNSFKSGLGKVFVPLCVMAPLVLLLCCAPVKKWRKSSFIPTPAPYFHTLYNDCHGDFKSWVVTQENTTNMLKAEETLQIDALTKCAEVQEGKVGLEEEKSQSQFQHEFMGGSTYGNITDPCHDTSLLGVPYAVSTMSPLSHSGGLFEGLYFSSWELKDSAPGSPAEGDSGCWLSSHSSLEKDSPWYCNEYCTLSAFQQISPVTAMTSCTNREEQSGCQS
ncbi:interleukin-21 receptor isoform X1 [Xyrichtys novacula]|uniref:Interleukin-21 receptor isoform X1 n=1 Tax=Xyrichtys novacula TaxID=13765 RepID=A0AAV1H4U3_XYRNO|nr:interleukin-21 receptor isoform X1 [Xyrichtys novacula]